MGGGGIFNSLASTLFIIDSKFPFNLAPAINVEGGLIDVRDTLIRSNYAIVAAVIVYSSSATFNNCNITDSINVAFLSRDSNLHFINCNISNNNAGGVSSFGGTTSLHHCNLNNNNRGGMNANSSTSSITESNIIGNNGGVVINGRNLTLDKSVIRDNRAIFGGGLYATNASVQVNNSTIELNIASEGGGGTYFSATSRIHL